MEAQESFQVFCGCFRTILARMNLGQQQLGMRKVQRIDLDGAGQIFLREIETAQLEIRDAELRIRQRVVGADGYGALIERSGFLKLIQVDQDAAEIHQRFVRIGGVRQSLSKTFRGAGEAAFLVGEGAQSIPGSALLGRQCDGLFKVIFGGVDIAAA